MVQVQRKTKFPKRKYRIIYADPPWDYYSAWDIENSDSAGIWGLGQVQYNTLNIEVVKKLPVQDIAQNDCFLFINFE